MDPTRAVCTGVALFMLCGCSGGERSAEAPAGSATSAKTPEGAPYAYERLPLDTSRAPGTIVDSVFPMPEMITRFRAGLPEVRALAGGEISPESLAAKFVLALAEGDSRTLSLLALSRAEFAYLYFPYAADAQRDGGLSPALRWDGILRNSEKGISRALDRIGRKPLKFDALQCQTPPSRLGPMTQQDGCTVRLTLADGTAFSGRLFGSIVGIGGRYKFVGYANDM